MVNAVFRFGQGKSSQGGAAGCGSSSRSNSTINTTRTGASQEPTNKSRRKSVKVLPSGPVEAGSFHDFDSGYQGDSDQPWDKSKGGVAPDSDCEMDGEDGHSEDEEDDDAETDRDYEVSARCCLQSCPALKVPIPS